MRVCFASSTNFPTIQSYIYLLYLCQLQYSVKYELLKQHCIGKIATFHCLNHGYLTHIPFPGINTYTPCKCNYMRTQNTSFLYDVRILGFFQCMPCNRKATLHYLDFTTPYVAVMCNSLRSNCSYECNDLGQQMSSREVNNMR